MAINIVLPGSVVSEIGRQKSVVSDAVLMVGLNQIVEDALLLELIAYYPNPSSLRGWVSEAVAGARLELGLSITRSRVVIICGKSV